MRRVVSRSVRTGRRVRRHDDRRCRRHGAATRVHGRGGRAVRDLHAGHDHRCRDVRPQPNAEGDAAGAGGQPVSMYRLRGDLPGDPRSETTGRYSGGHDGGWPMKSAISPLSLRRPKTLPEALRMLRDQAPLVPLAGATDLYVSLNFGTLAETRFLDLWPLDDLRRVEMNGDVLSIGALATYTSLIRSRLVQQRLPMLAAAAREIGGIQIQNRGT